MLAVARQGIGESDVQCRKETGDPQREGDKRHTLLIARGQLLPDSWPEYLASARPPMPEARVILLVSPQIHPQAHEARPQAVEGPRVRVQGASEHAQPGVLRVRGMDRRADEVEKAHYDKRRPPTVVKELADVRRVVLVANHQHAEAHGDGGVVDEPCDAQRGQARWPPPRTHVVSKVARHPRRGDHVEQVVAE